LKVFCKSELDNCLAVDKSFYPQYRFSYTGTPITLETTVTHTLTGTELSRQQSYDGVIWSYVDDGVINEFTFYSSDEAVATVDSSGMITAHAPGSCVIYAKYGNVDSDFTVVTIPVEVQIVTASTDEDFTYTITDGEAQITMYTGAGGVVTIPGTLGRVPVTSIGNYAFCNYCYSTTNSLISINIPEGVSSIGVGAFMGCKGLSSINIPQGMISIGNLAFAECRGLTSISIPQGVTNIGEDAFANCTGLTSVNIPQGLTSISNRAFFGCTGLTSINIPIGVTRIGDHAFSGCNRLTNISIPQGVTSIGDLAFYCCTGLTSILVDVDNANYSSIDGVLYNKARSILIACPAGLTSISIPQGVTGIGYGAFANCTGLTSISIPEGVTGIGNMAFSGCYNLTDISIPQGVISIGDAVYAHCSRLTSISIPRGVTSIGDSAFFGCDRLNKY